MYPNAKAQSLVFIAQSFRNMQHTQVGYELLVQDAGQTRHLIVSFIIQFRRKEPIRLY